MFHLFCLCVACCVCYRVKVVIRGGVELKLKKNYKKNSTNLHTMSVKPQVFCCPACNSNSITIIVDFLTAQKSLIVRLPHSRIIPIIPRLVSYVRTCKKRETSHFFPVSLPHPALPLFTHSRVLYGFYVQMCNLLFTDFNMCMCNPKVFQLFVPFPMRSVEVHRGLR